MSKIKVSAREVKVYVDPKTGKKSYFYTGDGGFYIEMPGGKKIYVSRLMEDDIEKLPVSDVAYDRKGNLLYVGEGANYVERYNGSRIYKQVIDISLVNLEAGQEIQVLPPLFDASEISVNVDPKTGEATFFHISEDALYMMVDGKKGYCGIVDEREVKKYPVDTIASDCNGNWFYIGDLSEGAELSDNVENFIPVPEALIDFESAKSGEKVLTKKVN